MDHTCTKTKHPQTNGICERFNRTGLNEFYRVTFRKELYHSLDELQVDLDAWLVTYNAERPHQGQWYYGKPPLLTFLDTVPLAKEKMLAAGADTRINPTPRATNPSVRSDTDFHT